MTKKRAEDLLVVAGAGLFLIGCWLLHPVVFCLVAGTVLVAAGLQKAKP